jgi:hypothetical protein
VAIKLADFRPYTSVTVARAKTKRAAASLVAQTLGDLEQILGLRESGGGRTLVHRADPVKSGVMTVGYLHYEE